MNWIGFSWLLIAVFSTSFAALVVLGREGRYQAAWLVVWACLVSFTAGLNL